MPIRISPFISRFAYDPHENRVFRLKRQYTALILSEEHDFFFLSRLTADIDEKTVAALIPTGKLPAEYLVFSFGGNDDELTSGYSQRFVDRVRQFVFAKRGRRKLAACVVGKVAPRVERQDLPVGKRDADLDQIRVEKDAVFSGLEIDIHHAADGVMITGGQRIVAAGGKKSYSRVKRAFRVHDSLTDRPGGLKPEKLAAVTGDEKRQTAPIAKREKITRNVPADFTAERERRCGYAEAIGGIGGRVFL